MLQRVVKSGVLVAAILLGSTAVADDAQSEALFEAMGLPDIIDIMRQEGIAYGAQIGADLFPTRVSPSWSAAIETIYDPEPMKSSIRSAFVTSLEGDDVDAMTAFFTSDLGSKFVALEVSARRALLDDAVDVAAKELAAIARADETPRFEIISEFVQTNDLIETNVVGALNSNYAFYMGLIDGGAFEEEMTEDQILSDVWDQEADIRNTTTEWIYSFLMLAYDPVTDAEIARYIDFSKSEAGKQLNATLFASFDAYFDEISFKLGAEAARMMTGAEL